MGDCGRISPETTDENQGKEVSENNFRLSECPLILVYYDLDDDGDPDDFYFDYDNDERIEMVIDINNTLFDGGELPHVDVDGDGNDDDLFADINSDNQTDILIDASAWTSDGEDGNNDGIIIGVDFNGDEDFNDWVGIDEGLKVQNETYWDDELKSDLDTLSYAELIFVRQGCVEGDKGCFGGGIIDDISANNRIIMTATNETWFSYGDMDDPGKPGYGFSEWSDGFIDALHGERAYYNDTTGQIVHTGDAVDADFNNDGYVSMWDAWVYAWMNDDARLKGDETPWLDDNGNGYPTYKRISDDPPQSGDVGAPYEGEDRLLSMITYLGFDELKRWTDINLNSYVNIFDVATAAAAFGSYPGHPRWNKAADIVSPWDVVNIFDVAQCAADFGKDYSDDYAIPQPSEVEEGGKGGKGGKSSTQLSVFPDEITVHGNQTFTADVKANNVTDLYCYEFKLYYNNTVLNCTGVDLPSGHFLDPNNSSNIYVAEKGYNNTYNATHGRVWVGVTLMGEESGKNGTGVLVRISFDAIALGNSTLDLQESLLGDSDIEEISHTPVDGSVTVGSPQVSTVGTSSSVAATDYSYQRKTFYASGRHWAWYTDGTNFVFRSSPDGSSWSDATSLGPVYTGHGYSASVFVEVNGSNYYAHYTRYYSYDLYYRKGKLNSNGSITWCAAEQKVYDGSPITYYWRPSIAVDSGGHAWIGVQKYLFSIWWSYYYPYVFRNEYTNGTWSSSTGFPYQLHITSSSYWGVIPVPLTSEKAYVLYGRFNDKYYGKLYNGTAWGSQETATDDKIQQAWYASAVNDNEDVHLVYLNYSNYAIRHTYRNYTASSWSTDVDVQKNVTSTSTPALCIDTANDELYCFWAKDDNVYYKKHVDGTWDSSAALWIQSETNLREQSITCFYNSGSDHFIGVAWTKGNTSPYDVRYATYYH